MPARNNFRARLENEAVKKDSRLLLNLNLGLCAGRETDRQLLLETAFTACRGAKPYIVGIKLARPFIDSVGYEAAASLLREVKLPAIADLKLADYFDNALWCAHNAVDAGFDAVTLHAFLGRDPLIAVRDEFPNTAMLAVVGMGHPSAATFLKPAAQAMCSLAMELGLPGAIAPGVPPGEIGQLRAALGLDSLLFATGLGAGRTPHGAAIRAGADYEIVGRPIYQAKDVEEAALRVLQEMRDLLRGRPVYKEEYEPYPR